jgi:hypothetical protein
VGVAFAAGGDTAINRAILPRIAINKGRLSLTHEYRKSDLRAIFAPFLYDIQQ